MSAVRSSNQRAFAQNADDDSIQTMLREARSITRREEAARRLWQRYAGRLLALVRGRLPGHVRVREDEHDVVQEAFDSFFRRHENGHFVIHDRDELWSLLAVITVRTAQRALARHQRACRDARRQTSLDAVHAAGCTDAHEPTPLAESVLTEEFERLLSKLPQALQPIAIWKLQGYTNEEIAGPDMLNRSVRTVVRRIEKIRHIWQEEGDVGRENSQCNKIVPEKNLQ